jgi:copper homeostasis protein
MRYSVTVEICVGDLESALAAAQGGADRVELCDNLLVGGTTPSAGVIAEACRRLTTPVHVLIRPRAGDFLPTAAELDVIAHDIEVARRLGAAGVVLGILNSDATIDRDRVARLIELARPLSVTFHKAFDQVRDPDEALETLIDLSVDRVLSSGCRATALEGIEVLRRLVQRAGGRIAILAGGRLTPETLRTILIRTGVRELHFGSAVTRTIASVMTDRPADGSTVHWNGVDANLVRAVVDMIRDWSRDSDGSALRA